MRLSVFYAAIPLLSDYYIVSTLPLHLSSEDIASALEMIVRTLLFLNLHWKLGCDSN